MVEIGLTYLPKLSWEIAHPAHQIPMSMRIHLFPALHAFWLLEKTALSENCISGTLLMIQLTRNSTICTYIGENPRVVQGLGVKTHIAEINLKKWRI